MSSSNSVCVRKFQYFGIWTIFRIVNFWKISVSGDKVRILATVEKFRYKLNLVFQASFKLILKPKKIVERRCHCQKFHNESSFLRPRIRIYKYENPVGSGVTCCRRTYRWEMSIIRWKRMEVGQTYHWWLILKRRSHGWYNGLRYNSSADERLGYWNIKEPRKNDRFE